jgi:hypothetical protein
MAVRKTAAVVSFYFAEQFWIVIICPTMSV